MKLHLGCGNVRLPGFVNIDALESSAVDRLGDVTKLDYDDASVDMIYSCAVIEHVGRRQWTEVLAEWARVLKPGGLLRISTMDFDACVDRYLDQRDLPELLGLLIGGQKDDYDWHGMIFNYDVLAAGLTETGFTNIRRYDWRDTELGKLGIDDFSQAYLPHMDKENGRLMMLNVEAEKGSAP